MWQIIHDWSDVCHSCWLDSYWYGQIFPFTLLVLWTFAVFITRKESIKEGRAKNFNISFPVKIPIYEKKIRLCFHILLPFIIVEVYWVASSISYTYEVLTDQYIDEDYERLRNRIVEGSVNCIQGYHIESYEFKSGKNFGDHYIKFSDQQELLMDGYDNNKYCYGKSKFFYDKFYKIKDDLNTDDIEFKICWVVDVNDRKSLRSKDRGKCIFEMKYRVVEPESDISVHKK
ncbi:hypothetical protein [Bacterioplanoides sp.]|uniref:hypothetical protein n=1 Tax=Bacterioplanoides sp. TaxID=2066072 RepID=UPI003AFFD856